MTAASTGDIQSLMDVLAPDVVLVTDGGGVKKAALRPILGRDKVVRFLDGVAEGPADADVVLVNGAPALRFVIDGELDTVCRWSSRTGWSPACTPSATRPSSPAWTRSSP